MTLFVTHSDPFTPFDTAPPTPSVNTGYVARIPHDEILPQVVGDAFRHRVGTKPLDLHRWFVRDPDWEPTLAMKRALIDQRRGDVVSYREDAHDVAEEAGELVLGWLGKTASNTGIGRMVVMRSSCSSGRRLISALPRDCGVPSGRRQTLRR